MPRGFPNSKTPSLGSTDDIEAKVLIPELREGGIDASDIEIVSGQNLNDAVAQAKFMEEKVVIEIESDDDPNAPVFVYLGNGGVTQYVERGKEQAVKRKFLYSALAAKAVKFASSFGKDNSGNEYNRLTPSARNTHRVRLVRDDNPQGGMKWVQSVMQSA